jgi:activator of HSP90 ATPase
MIMHGFKRDRDKNSAHARQQAEDAETDQNVSKQRDRTTSSSALLSDGYKTRTVSVMDTDSIIATNTLQCLHYSYL